MKRILNVVGALDSGGVETMLYNYYSNFSKDNFIFDFAVYAKDIGMIEEKFINNGSKVYHITPRKKSILKNLYDLFIVIKQGNYDMVYSHINFLSWIPLLYAKIFNVKIRIAHSHGIASDKLNFICKIKNSISRIAIRIFATHFFACSNAAGEYLYRKYWKLDDSKCLIVKNAIDASKFNYDEKIRKEYRKKYDLENKICLLHIGRFAPEKNHDFLMKVMQKLDKNKYTLVCVGDGETFPKYKNEFGGENIIFVGKRADVESFYLMGDIFLFPSLHEGLGIVLIEAQASGLKCIASQNIPKEVKMTEELSFLPLDIDEWIRKINRYCACNRSDNVDIISQNGYNIKLEAEKFEKKLLVMLNTK